MVMMGRRRPTRRLAVGGSHRRLLHRLEIALLETWNTWHRQIEIVRALPLDAPGGTVRGRQRRIQWRDDTVGRGSGGAVVWRSVVRHVPGAGVAAHVRRIREHRVRMMSGGVVLRHSMVCLVGRFVDRRWSGVPERGSMVMGIIAMLSLALLARMRVLW